MPARRFISPMLLTAIGTPPADAAWVLEPKLDGCRGQLHTYADSSVRLHSRPGRDCTAEFREIAAASRQLGRDVVLDGEIICLDAQGRPDFERIRRRLGLRRTHAVAAAAASAPVAFVAFDLLALGGRDLCAPALPRPARPAPGADRHRSRRGHQRRTQLRRRQHRPRGRHPRAAA